MGLGGDFPRLTHVLLDWMDTALGRTIPSPLGYTYGSVLTNHLSPGASVSQGCWRKKILFGTVLEPIRYSADLTSTVTDKSQLVDYLPHPFRHCKDGLILTTAALWSLFDNSLERLRGCKCTFKSGGGDFIQCRQKINSWFLWHTFSEGPTCQGEQCNFNVCVALTDKDPGEYVTLTSPCVLGWTVDARSFPDSALWYTLKVSDKFRSKKYRKYEIQNVQAQAFLSAPVVPSPQVGAAITFSLRNYRIANSLDYGSHLAMELVAATVVLIFDERRGIHFTCDGADIIEILCLEKLRALGYRNLDRSLFSNESALLRIPTWCHTRFVTSTGSSIPGENLVREASKTLSRALELSRTACVEDSALLYWPLDDVLRENGVACRKPRVKVKETSWHSLAFECPPLIFAVGELEAGLVNRNIDHPLQWIDPSSKELFPSGGIVGSRHEIDRWLFQANSRFAACLEQTENRLSFGRNDNDTELSYQIVGHSSAPAQPFSAKGNNLDRNYLPNIKPEIMRWIHQAQWRSTAQSRRTWNREPAEEPSGANGVVANTTRAKPKTVFSACLNCALERPRCLHYIE
jgi:hypothetical protein